MDHFADVGFKLDPKRGAEPLVGRAAKEGRQIRSPRGWYIRWAPGNGVELWVAMEDSGHVSGVNPYFAGRGRMQLGLEGLAEAPPVYATLEGGVEGWAAPDPGEPGSGLCPLIVDLPDFDLRRDGLRPGSVLTLRVAAFANWLKCFADDAEFASAQEDERVKYSSEFFVPTGMFASKEDAGTAQPRAVATFAGHVLEALSVENPDTHLRFHHLLVRSAAGIFDVVADAKPILYGAPKVGGVVTGEFWLSGRILDG